MLLSQQYHSHVIIPGNISLTKSRPDITPDPYNCCNKNEESGAQAISSISPIPGSAKLESPIKSIERQRSNLNQFCRGISANLFDEIIAVFGLESIDSFTVFLRPKTNLDANIVAEEIANPASAVPTCMQVCGYL